MADKTIITGSLLLTDRIRSTLVVNPVTTGRRFVPVKSFQYKREHKYQEQYPRFTTKYVILICPHV